MNLMDLGIHIDESKCWICGYPSCEWYKATCSNECHEELILRFEVRFGVNKRVVDQETMKTHKVPIRDIIEKGLRQQDLKHYPEWIPGES